MFNKPVQLCSGTNFPKSKAQSTSNPVSLRQMIFENYFSFGQGHVEQQNELSGYHADHPQTATFYSLCLQVVKY